MCIVEEHELERWTMYTYYTAQSGRQMYFDECNSERRTQSARQWL